MNPEPHVRSQLGAYVLGQLEASESVAVEAHLEGCDECRREADELTAVARLLPMANLDKLGAPAAPPSDLLDRVMDRIAEERESARRRRRRGLVGRAALGVAAAVAALLLIVSPFGQGGEIVALASTVQGVTGEVTLHERGESQWVELETHGLPVGEEFALWVQDRTSGERVRCGIFRVTPGRLHIALYSSVAYDRAQAVGVSSLDGEIVMQAPLPPAP
jgi:anti-sigma-K factor RskA